MPKEKVKRIEIGDLAESVTLGVQRAIAASKLAPDHPHWPPRIICGFILEPQVVPRPKAE
jgi:hypothetical protein